MPFKGPLHDTRELEQQSMAMKTSLKNEVALLQTLLSYSISFSLSNVNNFFLSSIPKKLYQNSGKGKFKSCCLVFMFSTKSEIRHFHVVVMH